MRVEKTKLLERAAAHEETSVDGRAIHGEKTSKDERVSRYPRVYRLTTASLGYEKTER